MPCLTWSPAGFCDIAKTQDNDNPHRKTGRTWRPMTQLLFAYYYAMRDHFGHRNWWPGESPFEVCVGAILTQNTSWSNVAKAIQNLKTAGLLTPYKLYELSEEELAELIRPAGYYRVKARRLRNLVVYLVENHQGNLNALFGQPADRVREELLSINGVGKETADSILLYAAGLPIFVVDAYTRRILVRHGLVAEEADYDTIQEFFHDHLPLDPDLFNDFHAQFVAVGHQYCKPKPRCGGCPLSQFLDGARKQDNS